MGHATELSGRFIIAVILAALFLGAGFWAKHQAVVASIQSAFVMVLHPIRSEYPSAVSAEQVHEIEQREQRLIDELQLESDRWWIATYGTV